jgi:tRNA-specific 2-thiouridylase
VLAKIRHAQMPAPASVHPAAGGSVSLLFDEPQRAAAPGQAAVFYAAEDPDLVLGGGTIRRRAPTRATDA